MLIITRSPGQEILIGDHSVVTVMSTEGDDVKLGFNTIDQVRRVDNRDTALASAQVKGRVAASLKRTPMEKPPVYVGVKENEGVLDIRASLRPEMVQVAGYAISRLSDQTKIGPANHEFVVVRSDQNKAVKPIRALVERKLLSWRFYEEKEQQDGCLISLYLRATSTPPPGDVRYLDLT